MADGEQDTTRGAGRAQQAADAIAKALAPLPDKAAKKRAKHLAVAEIGEDGAAACAIKSNVKSVPGVMTQRGCAYAGAKGVVWGPIKDLVHISHGPVGCGHYSWSQRRNYFTGTVGIDSFVTMQVTTDFKERDIVFGGDKKLAAAIGELETMFPLSRGLTIMSECPVGLIGDDIEAVAKASAAAIGKTIVPCQPLR